MAIPDVAVSGGIRESLVEWVEQVGHPVVYNTWQSRYFQLKRSGLTAVERGEAVSATGGTYDYSKITQYLLNKYPADALAEHDRTRAGRTSKTFLADSISSSLLTV